MSDKKNNYDWRKQPDGVPDRFQHHCLDCVFSTLNGCGKHKPGWPDVGDACYSFCLDTNPDA